MKKKPSTMHRLQFGDMVDRIFWLVITASALFAAHSINQLNEKMAVVIEHLTFADKRLDSIDIRVDRLEDRKHH